MGKWGLCPLISALSAESKMRLLALGAYLGLPPRIRFPETAWVDDSQRRIFEFEQLSVARHEDIGVTGHRRGQDPTVGTIFERSCRRFSGFRDDLVFPQEFVDFSNRGVGQTDLTIKHPPELTEYHFTHE